jgi:EAL domain-containing protein (putative c-di-GMP-specific phosphodiesterase class I)
MISENKIFSDLHIGIAPFDSEHIKPEDVLRDADIAMHYAKEKNAGIEVFDKEIRSFYLERIKLETELRYALEREELSMHYQPLIALSDGQLIGFEALLRWNHHEMGFISPGKFIPISEDSGLIIPITVWILKETCTQLAKWRKISPQNNDLIISVNISGKHLADTRLVRDVKNALKLAGLPATCLKLEITESTAMDNAENTVEVLNKLKKLGVQISIDDFGTGYSSLSYLHELPFDTLKIDRSFVMNTSDTGDSQLLQTIISLTKNLKKKVIAEGIETEVQLSLLTSLGCDYGQGYLFSKPLPPEQMEELLYKNVAWHPAFKDNYETTKDDLPIQPNENLPIF